MVIYANELHRRSIDLSLLVMTIVAPLVLTLILGFAFGQGALFGTVRIGIAFNQPHPSPALRDAVVAGIVDSSNPASVQIVNVSTPGSLRRLVGGGTLDGGIVVPSPKALTMAAASSKDSLATLTQLLKALVAPGSGPQRNGIDIVVSSNSPIGSTATRSIASGISTQIYEGALREVASGHLPSDTSGYINNVLSGAAASPARAIVPSLQARSIGSGSKNVLNYFAPSVAIIFVFVGASLATRSILLEREGGTLVRLAASPISPAAIVVGKMLAILTVSFVSILAIWGTTVVLFSADWGNTAGVVLMCVGTVLSMGGIAFMLTSLARDEREALGVSMVVGLALALLGGNMLPPGVLPNFLQIASLATPNGWALVGFGRLALEDRSVNSVFVPFLVLCLIALVTSAVGARRIRKLIRP